MKIGKTIVIASSIAGVSYLVCQTISEELFGKIFKKNDICYNVGNDEKKWLSESNVIEVNLNSFDGLNLNAYNIHNHETDNYIIMVHGLTSDKTWMYSRAMEFDKLGYNILLIDQRASGKSEGEYISYGQKESIDLTQWIDYLISKNPNVNICLYGVSMGAATIMMSCANDLPDNVKCIVEDCGYSSFEDVLDHYIKSNYNLTFTMPVLILIEQKMKEKFGISFNDINPKNCLDENEIPIMFVHGKEDNTVPFEMSKILYNHNKGVKKYYPVDNVGHCDCNQDFNYYKNINDFILSNL